jgi:type II secretory pathway pseudopilin PulG
MTRFFLFPRRWINRPWFAPAAAPCRSERGVNYLLVTLVGIAIALIFMVANAGGLLGNFDSARTAKAKEVMGSDISSAAHAYLMSNGTYPASGTAADVVVALAGYLPTTPCDPSDVIPPPCAPTDATSSFTIISGVTATNQTDFVIQDSIAHPGQTLNNLEKWTANYTAPATTCSLNACTHLVYDAIYGIMGKP